MPASSELGAYLSARRTRTRPEDIVLRTDLDNFDGPPDRRLPGLRREELAGLAGVSVDYYTRPEQGRHRRPCESVVGAQADALRLDDPERDHLCHLAQVSTDLRATRGGPAQQVRLDLVRMMDQLTDQAALVLGRRTTVLAANRLALALFTDWPARPARDRSQVRWLLLDPQARELHPDWEHLASDAVGALRLDAGRYPGDPVTAELVAELAAHIAEFRRWRGDHALP